MDVWVVGVKELKLLENDNFEICPSVDTCDKENMVDIPTIIDSKYEVIIKVEDIPKDATHLICYYS
jgi:hypothetical protein